MSHKAIFLDRDGVLVSNKDHYYIWNQDQLIFVDGVVENLKKLGESGFLLFIVSNQGGIARGLYTKEDIFKLHAFMIQHFNTNQLKIEKIVFCPHHPELGKCICHKPDSLMIEKIIAKYRISKETSYMIGDSDSDLEAAQKAGLTGIKIQANENMVNSVSFLFQ